MTDFSAEQPHTESERFKAAEARLSLAGLDMPASVDFSRVFIGETDPAVAVEFLGRALGLDPSQLDAHFE